MATESDERKLPFQQVSFDLCMLGAETQRPTTLATNCELADMGTELEEAFEWCFHESDDVDHLEWQEGISKTRSTPLMNEALVKIHLSAMMREDNSR